MTDVVRVQGTVVIRLVGSNGQVLQEQRGANTITSSGLDLIAQLAGDLNSADKLSHIAVGTGTNSPTATQAALITEIDRIAFSTTTVSSGALTARATFGTTTATGTITEAGIFNATGAGTMGARFLTSEFSKGAEDSLEIAWTLSLS